MLRMLTEKRYNNRVSTLQTCKNVAKNVAYIWKNAQYADLRLNKGSVCLHRNLLLHLSIFSY